MRFLTVLLILWALAGCGKDAAGPSTPDPATHVPQLALTVTEGDAQTAPVAQTLPQAIVVTVMDTATAPAGAIQASAMSPVPVTGQLVNFIVTSGSGSVFSGSAITDSLGQAQEFFTLGTEAGEQCLEARAVIGGQRVTFSSVCATATPGPAGNFTLTSLAPDSFATGGTIDILNQIGVVSDIYSNLIGYGLLIPDSLISGPVVRVPADLPVSTRLYSGGTEFRGTSRYIDLTAVPAGTWNLQVYMGVPAYDRPGNWKQTTIHVQ